METNFKVDVPSFALGYSAGKKKGGGTPEGFHMVRFFNDDRTTLLYTVFVPTGANAMYAGETPASAIDHTMWLVGFEPSPTNIKADFDCFAVYEPAITTLDNTSWAKIAELSEAGTAEDYFAIGDTKMIHIEGTVGTLDVNGDYGVYIIGFDHNKFVEGKGITFGTFKTAVSNGKDICFDVGISGLYDGTKQFNINHWGASNHGGWAGCDMRYDILGSTDTAPSGYEAAVASGRTGYDASDACATNPVANTLMACLPSDLRAVMKPMTKYTDNTGGGSTSTANVTATIDYLPLLAEFEIFGKRTNANNGEQKNQKQYDYFAAGKSKIKYKRSAQDTAWHWWQRSVYYNSNSAWCYVSTGGISSTLQTSIPYGIAPIFKV